MTDSEFLEHIRHIEDNWQSLVTTHYLPTRQQFTVWAKLADFDTIMESYKALRKKLLVWSSDANSTQTWADAEAYLSGIIRNKAEAKRARQGQPRNEVIREV